MHFVHYVCVFCICFAFSDVLRHLCATPSPAPGQPDVVSFSTAVSAVSACEKGWESAINLLDCMDRCPGKVFKMTKCRKVEGGPKLEKLEVFGMNYEPVQLEGSNKFEPRPKW
mgnify:CR=1 FL=1